MAALQIEGLVRALREGDDAAKTEAADALWNLVYDDDDNKVLIAEAGGIPLLVELLRDGSAKAKFEAAAALCELAWDDDNPVLIAEAGGIPPLVELLRDGSADAKQQAANALWYLASTNDANAVEIAAAVGLEALVQLARRGRVTVNNQWILTHASLPAKRKAALVVAALLDRDGRLPREIKALIGPYL